MKTLAIIADSHTNSTVGLAKPTIDLDDGDHVHASTARRWIFHVFEDILRKIEEKKRGELFGLLNGDIAELGAKHPTLQLITRSQEEAVRMGVEVFEPFFAMCKGVYATRGTEAHGGLSAQAEEAIAGNFDNIIRHKDTGNATRWWLPLELDGVRMDIAHHPRGGGGGRPFNKYGPILRIAADTEFDYADQGKAIPHLVIRSHLHAYRDSKDAFRTRAIITPAMSLLTAHTHRIGINQSEKIGAILIYCDAGRYHVEPLLYKVREEEWEIQ